MEKSPMLKETTFEVHTDGHAMPVLVTASEAHAESTDRALSALSILAGKGSLGARANPARRRAGGGEDYSATTAAISRAIGEQEAQIADALHLDAAPATYTDAMAILLPKGKSPLYEDRRESQRARDRIADAYNAIEDLLVVLGARRIAESLSKERLQGQVGDAYVKFFANPRITEQMIGSGVFSEIDYIASANTVTFDTLSGADQDTVLAGLRFFSCFFDISTEPPTEQATLPVFRAFALLKPQDRVALLALFKNEKFSGFANNMSAMGGHDGIPAMYALYAIMFFKDTLFGTSPNSKRRTFTAAVVDSLAQMAQGATLPQVLRAALGVDVDAACSVYQGSTFPVEYLDTACRILGTYDADVHRGPLTKLFKKNEFEAPGAVNDVVLRVFGLAFCISRMKDSQPALTEVRLVGVEETARREKVTVEGVEYVNVRYTEHIRVPNSEAGYAIALIEAKTIAPKRISTNVLYNSYILGQNNADIHYFEWCALLFENFLSRGKPLTVSDDDYKAQTKALKTCLDQRNIDGVCARFDRIRADRRGAAYTQLAALAEGMTNVVRKTKSDDYSDTNSTFVVKAPYSTPDADVKALGDLGLVDIQGSNLAASPNNVAHFACLLTILAVDVHDFSSYAFELLNNQPMPTDGPRYEFWKSVKHNPLSAIVGTAEISGCCVRPGNWGASCALSALFVGDLDYNVIAFGIDVPTSTGGTASDFYGIFTHYALSWTTTDLAGEIRGLLPAGVLESARRDGCALTPGATEIDFTLTRRDLRTELGNAIIEGSPYTPPKVVSVFDNREAGVANNLRKDIEDLKISYLQWFQETDHMKQIGIVAQEQRDPAQAAFNAIRPQTMHELSRRLKFKQATKTYTDNQEFKFLLRSTLGEALVTTADAFFTSMRVQVNDDLSAEVTYDDMQPMHVQPDYLLYMFSWPKGPKFMLSRGSIEFSCAASIEAFVLETLMFPAWFRTPLVRDGRATTYDDMARMRMPRGGLILNGTRVTL